MSQSVRPSTPPREHSRIVWMDTARGLAVLLVILDHGADIVTENLGFELGPITWFNDAVAPFRMATLMFLSGLLLPKSLAKSTRVFVVGKLSKIGWPYIVWSAILLTLLAATSVFTGNASVSLGTIAQVFYNPPTYLWYLAYLFLYYLIALAIPSAIRTIAVPILIVVALVASGLVYDHFEWRRFLVLFSVFLLGDIAARYAHHFSKLTTSPIVIAVSAPIAAMAAYLSATGWEVRYSPIWWIPTIAGIICTLAIARATQRISISRQIDAAGANSLVYYTTHWSVMLVIFHSMNMLGIDNVGVLLSGVLVGALIVGRLFVWLRDRSRIIAILFEFPVHR